MSRSLRIEFPGALYHVTSRGNGGGDIYLDSADRREFLRLLGAVCARFNWRVHAWCQMTNHYHLVIETEAANLGRGMRQLNGVYTQAFNRAHGRAGHVFQGRYKAILVERDAYLLELCRYVALNPVRARMVRKPGRWRWSSYRATAGEIEAEAWHETGWLLSQFSRSKSRAQAAYAAFVTDGIGGATVWDGLKRQVFLGSDDFADEMAAQGGSLKEVPRAQTRAKPPALKAFSSGVESRADRDQAMARACLDGGYGQADVARHFGVHYSTVSRAVKRFEER
jgi:REP element-mobilizing transposase RayT